jgi:hypothetical protein
MENRDTTGAEEFAYGLRRAREVFDRDECLPPFVTRPRFDRPAAAAIMPAEPSDDMVEDGADAPRDRPLRTLRGLGPLLAP